MGMCRACLPVLGFSAVAPLTFLPVAYPASALLLYIIALSMSARGESRVIAEGETSQFPRILLIASGFIAVFLSFPENVLRAAFAFIPFGIWMFLCLTKYRSPVPAHVSALLAGIPLIDFIILLPVASLVIGMPGFADQEKFVLICTLLPLSAFLAGRRLQRLAPAT